MSRSVNLLGQNGKTVAASAISVVTALYALYALNQKLKSSRKENRLTEEESTLIEPPTPFSSLRSILKAAIERLSCDVFIYEDAAGLIEQMFLEDKKLSSKTLHHKREIRNGCGSSFLGMFLSTKADSKIGDSTLISTVCPVSALPYMLSSLSKISHSYFDSPYAYSLNVVNLSTDTDTNALITDQSSIIHAAIQSNFVLLAPLRAADLEFSCFASAALSFKAPVMHAVDGFALSSHASPALYYKLSTDLAPAGVSDLICSLNKEPIHNSVENMANDVFGRISLELGMEQSAKAAEFIGSEQAETVIVTFGMVESELVSFLIERTDSNKLAQIALRITVPFPEHSFLSCIPAKASKLIVLGQVSESEPYSWLYQEVLAFSYSSLDRPIEVLQLPYDRHDKLSLKFLTDRIGSLVNVPVRIPSSYDNTTVLSIIFASNTHLMPSIGQVLASDAKALNVLEYTKQDKINYGGITQEECCFGSSQIAIAHKSGLASVVFLEDVEFLELLDWNTDVAENCTIIIKTSHDADKVLESLVSSYPLSAINRIKASLFIIDINKFLGPLVNDLRAQKFCVHSLFAKFTGNDDILKSSRVYKDYMTEDSNLFERLSSALKAVEYTAIQQTNIVQQTKIKFNDHSFGYDEVQSDKSLFFDQADSKLFMAQKLAFKEAYDTKAMIRPELKERVFRVRMSRRERLTPMEYERNIFHIEFDISGTGLKYNIGEALAVYAHNNYDLVEEFMQSYGLDGNELVELTLFSEDKAQTITLRQALRQNLDLFGKPSKKFYEAISMYAEDDVQRRQLQSLGSSTGALEFKHRSEVDFVTYADILLEFDSVRLNKSQLCEFIPPLKRREYSISSSQKVHPNSVHLLIVVVDWKDPRGRTRYGQCSHYLSQLEVGDIVTVSVKKSVMRLPPSTTQPIIMAGLGTGLAPFRALVEERALQKAKGAEIGPVMLYLGSRHKREEFLYGEEWEAYQQQGVITLLGCAFSRDQPHKIYIQDVMRSTLKEISDAMYNKEGYFYLCGPTWPVPQMTEVLQDALKMHMGKSKMKMGELRKAIEDLKEYGRYVLEVY